MKKLNIHNLKAKEIKKLHTWLRALIQILYFLFLPSVYTTAFAGVKYIFTQIGVGEAIGMPPFVTVLVVLCAVYDSFRKILLWIRMCIRKSWRWNSCILYLVL